MEKRTRNAVVTAVTGAVAAGTLATGLAFNADAGAVRSATPVSSASPIPTGASANGLVAKAEKDAASSLTASESFGELGKKIREEKASRSSSERAEVKKTVKPEGMPSGTATATSFWDPTTASGKPMSYETLASPYWPLGTKVLVTYNGQSSVGVVDDFGPAEWAVAQHSPPAIIDISEKMMADFTGSRENSVTVQFQVLELGSGGTYRSSGTGYDLAMGG